MRLPSLNAIRVLEQRHRWRIVAVLGVYTAWLLFGWLAIPRIVAPRLERAVTEATGHPTTLGAMEFDPLWLAVTLHDLRIATPQGETLIAVDRIHVDFETRSLIDRAWNFKALEIDGPYVNAVLRADGSLNLGDLAGAQSAEPAPAAPGPVTLPRVVLQSFALRGGTIDFTDLGLTPTLKTSFPNLGLSLTDFSTLPNDRGEYALQARGPAGGLFQWRGTVGANPFASDGRFTLEGGGLPPWFDLVGDRFAFDVTDGLLRARVDYSLGDSAAGLAFKITDAEAEIDQLALGPRDGAPLLTLPSLTVTGVKVDLNAHKVQVGEVRLDKLGLKLARDAGGIDLIELFTAPPPAAASAPPSTGAVATAAAPTTSAVATTPGPATAAAEPAPPPRPTLPWRIALDRFALTAADVALTDETLATPGTVSVAPLDLAVTDVAFGPETRFTVLLDAVINGAGKLLVQGPLVGTDPAGTLAVKLDGLALAPFQPWIDPIARIQLLGGALDVDAKLTLAPPTLAAPTKAMLPVRREKRAIPAKAPRPGAEPAIQFSGYAQLADLRVQDAHLKQDLLRWKRLQLRGLDVALAPQRFRIDEVYVEQPYLRFIIGADGSTNLSGLMVGADAPKPTAAPEGPGPAKAVATAAVPASPAAKPAAAPLPLEIKRVRVAGGSANFADQSLTPVFATGIQDLTGSIVGLSSQEAKRAEITLDGKVDRYAPVKIRGQVNLFAAEAFSDVTMSFHDIELTTFTPYAGKFAGYKIDKGRLSLDIRYQLEDRHIKGDHKIVLDQLTLGERVDSADAMSLPIKLALALLKDSRGVIDLDLPIEGSLDDPQFRYGPIVWKAVMSVFTKIVTAPFAALGALFGGGDDLSKLEFMAGSATLDPASTARLDTLAKGLAERPALRLDVRGVAAPIADGGLLARRRVLDAVRPDGTAVELIALTPKEQKTLMAMHQQRFGTAPVVTGLAEGAKPDDDQLHEAALAALANADGPAPDALRTLAQARAAAVKDYLVTRASVPAERVFLLEAETTQSASAGEPVAMTLTLNAE